MAPYTCTIVNSATNATVAIGTASVPAISGTNTVYTGTTNSVPIGNYNIYMSSSNGCSAVTNFQVVIPFSSANVIFTPTNVSCYGGSDGAIFASTTGPFTPPFSFTWMPTGPPTQTTQTALNLPVGIYSVTIKDSKGCVVTNSTQLTQPSDISSSITNTFISCFGGTINTQIVSTGGTGPYTYSVNGLSVSGSTATSLAAGIHTILTKDTKGCIKSNTVQITQVIQPLIVFSYTSPLCPGNTNGAASATISNAPPAYTYTWQPALSFTNNIANIPAGTYTLTVKDASACITKSVVVVTPAVNLTVSTTTGPENCSAQDGTVGLNVSGGNFPYTFTTIPVGAHSTSTIGGLSSGSYTTIIKDANGCEDTVRYVVGNLSTVSLSVSGFTPVLCYNQCTGAVQLFVQNGAAPLTFSATGTPTTSSSLIQNLCSGFYIIKVIDNIGCPATATVNFTPPPVFSYSASGPPAICSGNTVVLQATASGGAPGSYSYIWNPGNLSGSSITVVPAATTVYSLNAYDNNGCTLAPFTITVNVADPISININSSSAGICPGTTAQITPTVTGGDGNYVYNWLPGNSNASSIFVQNITVPSYTLYVSDGCGSQVAMQVININLFPVIVPTYSVNKNKGCEPLCIMFENTTPNSTNVIWNYGDKPLEQQGNTTQYCYNKAGVYNLKLTVNDSNSCKTSFTYTGAISVLKAPEADFITNPEVITLNNSENVKFENITTNASTYEWLINDTEYSNENNIEYTFSDTGCVSFRLIAKNIDNCRDTTDKQICVLEGFRCWVPNCFTPNTDNDNEIFIPKGTGWVESNYLFEVYNRWGKKIFQTNNFNEGWDGKAAEKLYDPSNVYFWRLSITDNISEVHNLKGHVLLLR